MQTEPGKSSLKFIFKLKKKEGELGSSDSPDHADCSVPETIDTSPRKDDVESQEKEDEANQSNDDSSKQLVVYDPPANGPGEIVPMPDPIQSRCPSFSRSPGPNQPSKISPSVGAFTVQCANCFKWRLIPTKEKYEEIREHILEDPFYCETARKWRPDISCDDPEDISQDGSRLWAIDKPNIAQPPPGWQRLLHIRGEGSTKFADVYYVAPSGKRLRSMVEVQKYLLEHPEFTRDGVTLSQFSFQIPRPLHDNYVRKRPARAPATCDGGGLVEPGEARPLAWAGPDDLTELHLKMPGLPSPRSETSDLDLVPPSAKKRPKKAPNKQMYSSKSVTNQHGFGVEDPSQCRSSNYEI
ncbi:uncharacterized protein J3R85_015187 [Psidium guajava]|nr:uncharacterized protein J3R85_015187 [Psidium guajava]